MAISSETGASGALDPSRLAAILSDVFLNPGSTFSLLSLASAALIAGAFLLARRRGKRPASPRLLIRALFPRRFLAHASTRADILFFVLNVFVTGLLVGWALVSAGAVGLAVHAGLLALAPTWAGLPVPGWAATGLVTLAGFLAYDFAYWLDHYIKHRLPTMWAFHSTHHTAEVLTPLTSFRMHPVDSLIFYNISAVLVGLAQGASWFLIGDQVSAIAVAGMNGVVVVFIFTLLHLQHSHIRMGWSGWVGRLILSPAHHHVHHSNDPRHYGRNLGFCLAIWDWMAGTLMAPQPGEQLVFGAHTGAANPHSLTGSLLHPFAMAAESLAPQTRPTIAEAAT
jgi:sterol desaturase/sphingolipid hydroxylase (fatty acid hydroxylase superfamily)